MDKKPKRRRYKDNPYDLIKDEESKLYLVSFVDGTKTFRTIKVSKEIYDVMDYYEKLDIRQMNEYDRHTEHILLDETELSKRVKNKPIAIDDSIIYQAKLENLMEGINKLPEIQKRRIKKYYFDELNETEIAEQEGTTQQAINYTLTIAKNNLKNFLKKFYF